MVTRPTPGLVISPKGAFEKDGHGDPNTRRPESIMNNAGYVPAGGGTGEPPRR
jgi:hypothetical protein